MFDNVHEMDNGEEMYAISGNETEWALLSYMARVNYSYEDRYLLTATIRRDGSSRFGKKHRWGTFLPYRWHGVPLRKSGSPRTTMSMT